MPTWEFLLQKKGDKSWLPLESPTLEILEGEYRLAARTSLDKASIDINIDYSPSDRETNAWQRRLTRAVNSQGLVLVAPFLDFTSGTWQFSCGVGSEVKFLSIEVLGAISDYWEGFDLVIDNQLTSAMTPEVDLPKMEIPKMEILENENFTKTSTLPTELITLYESEFIIKGGEALEIMGEAYLSGDIEIILTNDSGDIIHNEYAHDSSDSDFFSYTITIPEQAEAQRFVGQVRISPHEPLKGDRITSQVLSVDCQALFNPFRKFPVLPFENLPAHVPVRRNIKFPELPEFLTGRKNKSQVSSTPKKPIPNWQISNPFKIPNYSDNSDLRYEFE
jgi:hypothetical protein